MKSTGQGGINLGEILNNPMFQSMAQQMMQNPQMMNLYGLISYYSLHQSQLFDAKP